MTRMVSESGLEKITSIIDNEYKQIIKKVILEIQLQLYSMLREALPKESQGRAVLHFEERASLVDVLKQLGIKRRVVISVNGILERDHNRLLRDGDEVKIFSSVSGG